MDEWDAMGHGMKIDRRSSEWGFTSLLIGGCFLIMGPIMLIFNDFYWAIGIRAAAPGELQQIRVIAPIISFAFLSLIGFGLFAGFRGMGLARSSGHPVALSLGGILCCLVDAVVFLGLSINLFAIVGLFQ